MKVEIDIITEEQIKLAKYAKALCHPIRVHIIDILAASEHCYSGDLDELGIAKSTLSQHLKVLRESGLIQGHFELPKIKYCLNKENWQEARGLFKKHMML